MLKAAEDAQRLYGDIIDLPHPVSKKHPPLTMQQKAAQFSPFAALSGYEEAIDETGRLTQEKLSLGEDRRAQLDEQLQKIVKSMEMQQKTTSGYCRASVIGSSVSRLTNRILQPARISSSIGRSASRLRTLLRVRTST